ncbi:M20 peptidase aminoacylase family protein [Pseudoneobacillus rhizosphaerae]|uniref:N-acetylcysteine deacetylase n=1 Tax=Pseudoneobacillus rhizosphaerae TaxID=2880968 RepID=A0A9C7G6Z9_9BACI|nr:M20 peptidase aminoacylase family protein [Pseudoneobacillus rhizosphaerae]CAG9606929.1 N-acetylcysteine deacetylase [Pseudoneobacillus rhizosphaerae]
MIKEINEWVAKCEDVIKSTYHHLHTHAEVSWREVETTKFLCSQLEKLGIRYETFEDHTGVIGYWGNKEDGPTIGIRADMDALFQLVDGEWKANHSCGHDAHMTMVLHTITCLKEIGYTPKGLIKIIFQPAEESGKGAQAIIEKGVIEDINYLLGIHLRPIQEMEFGKAAPAIYHGATTLLKGEVKGIQAHGARPHLGINVVDSVGSIIHAVNSVKMDPTVSASAKVTMIKAGGDNLNTIPDHAEFGLDVRAEQNEVMTDLLKRVQHAVVTSGSVNHAEVKLEPLASMVAAEASSELERIVEVAIVEALGEDGLVPPPVTPGGEDFHFYKQTYPHIQSTMVGLGTGLAPGLHHPNMSFNLDALLNGVRILSLAILQIGKVSL